MKQSIITSALLALTLSVNAQSKPSTYEHTKYDSYYGWDTIKPTPDELVILNKYQLELISIREELRKHNLSRCHINTLPEELRTLEYVNQLKVNDKVGVTVPVFKLIFNNTTNVKQQRRVKNNKVLEQLKTNEVKPLTYIPNQYTKYINSDSLTEPITTSRYYEDPFKPVTTVVVYTDDYSSCPYDRNHIISIYNDNAYKLDAEILIDMYLRTHTFTVRVYVSANGNAEYVSGNFTNNKPDYNCEQEELKSWATLYLNTYEFVPAKVDGKPIDSYVDIDMVYGIGGKEDKNKTPRKPKN